MPVGIHWYNEDNDILIVEYTGRWDWPEVCHIDIVARRMLEESQRRVDIIADMTRTRWFPPNGGVNIQSITAEPYMNLQMLVLAGDLVAHELVQIYLNNFGPLPFHVAFASSFKQAFDKILRCRLTAATR